MGFLVLVEIGYELSDLLGTEEKRLLMTPKGGTAKNPHAVETVIELFLMKNFIVPKRLDLHTAVFEDNLFVFFGKAKLNRKNRIHEKREQENDRSKWPIKDQKNKQENKIAMFFCQDMFFSNISQNRKN